MFICPAGADRATLIFMETVALPPLDRNPMFTEYRVYPVNGLVPEAKLCAMPPTVTDVTV